MRRVFKNIQTAYRTLEVGSIYVSLLSLVLISASCDKALEVEAEGTISGDIFTSEENIVDALAGAYYSLGGIYDGVDGGELFGGDFMLIPALFVAQNASEVSWDRTNGPQYSDFIDNSVQPTNTRLESNWRRAYEVINVLNNIILNIENVTTDKDKVHGEALAMRGILYFEMVRLWGAEYEVSTSGNTSIPLLLTPIVKVEDIKTPTLATLEAVYTQVKADLSSASGMLQSLGKNGTNISYYTCQAYLMRVAMHQGEYGTAKTHADNIIAAVPGTFDLATTPMEAFNNSSNSVEDIFAIQQTLSNNAGDITSGTGATNYYSSLSGKGIGALRVLSASLTTRNESLVNGPRYNPEDLRNVRDGDTNEFSTPESVTGAFYRHISSTSLFSSSKFMSSETVLPVVRLAEIYLARAECDLMENDAITTTAIEDLNMIRGRAGLSALQTSDFAVTTALMDSIKLEKKREFLYEGLIFHDLRRWNDEIGNSTPETYGQDAKFILPIPQSETDTWN